MKNILNNKKSIILSLFMVILAFSLPTIALATQETSYSFHTQAFEIGTNMSAPSIPMALDIYATNTCSGSPLFTGNCITDINGVCDITVTIQANFNEIYYACVYANSSLIDGSPQSFRAGQGQVDEFDVNFTDLNITNDLDVGGDIDSGDDIYAVDDITADGYFIGDGSLLTNLNLTGSVFWNRTGTTLEPATFGDDINATGDVDILGALNVSGNIYGANVVSSNGVQSITDWVTSSLNLGQFQSGGHTFNLWDGSSSLTLYMDKLTGNLWSDGNITADDYFIGDGSQLTNLPISSYLNKTGTALYPATLGDYIALNGTQGEEITFDYPTNNVYLSYDGTEFIIASENTNDEIYIYGDDSISLEGGVNGVIMESILDLNGASIYGAGSSTQRIQWNGTSGQWEILPILYAPDIKCDSTRLNEYFNAYFGVTSGTTTNVLQLDGTTQRIYNRMQQTTGGSQSGTGYIREEFMPEHVSWNTTNSVCLYHRTNDFVNTDFDITVYINGVADATVNGVTFNNVANNVWLQSCFQPTSATAPDDKVNVEVTVSNNGNGDYGDLADIEEYTLINECGGA